jgi:hypothetical protein
MKFAVIVGILFLSGCSIIAPKVGPQVAKAVNRYCVEPYATRSVLRAQVNEMVFPHEIKVTCEGDPQ